MAGNGFATRFNSARSKPVLSRNCVVAALIVVAIVIVYAFVTSLPSRRRLGGRESAAILRPVPSKPTKRVRLEPELDRETDVVAEPRRVAAPVAVPVEPSTENLGDCDPEVEECFEVAPGDARYDCIVHGDCDSLRQRAAPRKRAAAVAEPQPAADVADARPAAVRPAAPSPALPAPAPAIALPPAPPRPAEWVPAQRPIKGERDRPVSKAWEDLTVVSMNPPPTLSTYPAPAAAELASRLVVAVGCGVHSGGTHIDRDGIVSLPVFNTMMPSFVPTAQTNFIYRFYFAFDHNDAIYESAEWRGRVEAEFQRYVVAEDSKRFHRAGYVSGQTIDDTSLIVTLHWVHCNYASKPAWAHSDAVMAAFREGADYAYRPNDDTKFPEVPDWADRFIIDLRERKPISNLGVVGPRCGEGANWILTHDFTHVTHAYIFGYQYPRSLPNWSSDDWITYVYKYSNLMSKRDDVVVQHMMHGQRYAADPQGQRLAVLNAAVHEGGVALNEWTQKGFGVTLPRNEEPITCC